MGVGVQSKETRPFCTQCLNVLCSTQISTWGADKSLARPGRKQSNVSVGMA